MRDLGAMSVCVYGVEVRFLQFEGIVQGTAPAIKPDDEDGADEVDGTPMAVGPEAEAWLAQKIKQETQTDTRTAPQPDLMDWYTARPLPSVD